MVLDKMVQDNFPYEAEHSSGKIIKGQKETEDWLNRCLTFLVYHVVDFTFSTIFVLYHFVFINGIFLDASSLLFFSALRDE